MKALTLWQPWATLMAIGDKTIETRSAWALRLRSLVGADVAIHAAARRPTIAERVVGDWTIAWHPQLDEFFLDHDHHEQIEEMPLGAVVAVVRVRAVVPMRGPGEVTEPCLYLPGSIPDAAGREGTLYGWHIVDAGAGHGWTDFTAEQPYGHYEPGRVGIVTDELRRLEPVPCAGHQQVWNLPPDAEMEVYRQLGTTSGRLL